MTLDDIQPPGHCDNVVFRAVFVHGLVLGGVVTFALVFVAALLALRFGGVRLVVPRAMR